jgi:hypothetical protein
MAVGLEKSTSAADVDAARKDTLLETNTVVLQSVLSMFNTVDQRFGF